MNEEIKICPAAGERFERNGITFAALGVEQGGLLAIAEEPISVMPFDEERRNNWRMSTLREYLNGAFLDRFGRGGLLPFTSDLTSDDGLKDYGTAEDFVFLLSCDLYRKYRQYIPEQRSWWWTLTPWTTIPDYAYYVRRVSSSGALSNRNASDSDGVVPSLLFNLESFGQQLGAATAEQSAEIS